MFRSFNTTAWVAGMCSSPFLVPWLGLFTLILFYYKTPPQARASSRVLLVLSPLHPRTRGREWPFMFPYVFALATRFSPASMTTPPTPCTWMFIPQTVASAPRPPNLDSIISTLVRRGGHSRSVCPDTAFQQVEFPYLVAGDFNIQNPASDPLRVFSYSEELDSAPFYDLASERGFRLLNTPGIYTRFPLSGSHRPSAIDLAFTNPVTGTGYWFRVSSIV